MNREKKAPSVLEVLIEEKILPEGTSLKEATEQLLSELNCVECIAVNECADCYGEKTINAEKPRCREVVRAYLKQDYIKKEDK